MEMKRHIYKYKLAVTDYQTVTIPDRSRILCAQLQDGEICIWVECFPNEKNSYATFKIFGTGHPMDISSDYEYLSTVQMGSLVWHIYYNY